MSKLKQNTDSNQLNIFDLIQRVSDKQKSIIQKEQIPGTLNIDLTLREMISQSLKRSKLSRYDVVAEMSNLLGKEITKTTLDTFSAESKGNHRFPVTYLNALMEATGDKSILRLICEKAGGFFIEGEDALTLELGKIHEQKRELQKKEKTIKDFLASLRGNR